MKIKQIFIILLTISALAAMSVTALAAGADDVKAELRKLQQEYPDNAQLIKLVEDANDWLSNPENAAKITSDVAATVKSEISAAKATAGAASRLSELSSEQANSIISNISSAAAAADLKFEVSANNSVFVLKDANGQEISAVSLGNPIKQTGTQAGLTGLIIAGSVITVLTAFSLLVFAPKKRKSRCG